MYKLCSEVLKELEKDGVRVNHDFKFPDPVPLDKCLGDILEKDPDEKYYLIDEQTKNLQVKPAEEISRTIRTGGAGSLDRHTWDVIRVGGLYDKPGHRHQAGSVFDPSGLCATLSTMQGGNQEPIVTNLGRIRRLTPRECWRLMGFPDDAFDKAQAVGISNSQLYKQAGNSICVSVLEAIFKELFNDTREHI